MRFVAHRPIDAVLDDVKRMAEARGGDPWAEPMSAEQEALFTEFATHPRVLKWCRESPAGRVQPCVEPLPIPELVSLPSRITRFLLS